MSISSDAATVYSLSEIEAHAKKAVRGARFAWGYAEEAAKAVRLLAAYQLPGAVALAAYLAERAEVGSDEFAGPVVADGWSAADGQTLCPVLSGAALCDYTQVVMTEGQEVMLANLAYPLLVLPYVALLSRRSGYALQVNWEGVELSCYQGRLVKASVNAKALLTERAERFSCCPIAATDGGEEAGNRGQVISDAVWQALNEFAHQTYVPATEASRRGAGPAD